MIEALGTVLILLGIVLMIVIGIRSSTKRTSPLKLKPYEPVSPEPLVTPPPKQWPPNTLEELVQMSAASAEAAEVKTEREAEIRRAQAQIDAKKEKRRAYLWIVGFFARLTTYATLFFVLYAYSPNDISHTPLAALTLSDILGTIFFVLIGLFLLRALFNPSDDDDIKDAWGKLGFLYLAAGVIMYYVFTTHGTHWH